MLKQLVARSHDVPLTVYVRMGDVDRVRLRIASLRSYLFTRDGIRYLRAVHTFIHTP
jgi:hypothetical protein